jgi:hypothetical protein
MKALHPLWWGLVGIGFLLIALRDEYFSRFPGQTTTPPKINVFFGSLLVGLAILGTMRRRVHRPHDS